MTTCGSLPVNERTTLQDIKNTINVLHSNYSYFSCTSDKIGYAYSQALSSLDHYLRDIKPIERDNYVSKTDIENFDLFTWQVIFKYNLWDAMVSYSYNQVKHDYENGSIITKLVSVRLEIDKRESQEMGKSITLNKIRDGYGFTWKELFNALVAKIKWVVKWDIVYKIKMSIKQIRIKYHDTNKV